MMDPERASDAELAAALLRDLGPMAPDADDPPALIKLSTRAWIGRMMAEAPRQYGADQRWRGVEPRTDGIVAAVLEIVAASGQQQPEGAPGRGLPPMSLPEREWQDGGVERIARMTIAEINAMPLSEYAAFRQRAGLNGQGRGLLSQEEKWA